MKTSQEQDSQDGGQGCDKARAISGESSREYQSNSLIMRTNTFLPREQVPMAHLHACRSILAQVE